MAKRICLRKSYSRKAGRKVCRKWGYRRSAARRVRAARRHHRPSSCKYGFRSSPYTDINGIRHYCKRKPKSKETPAEQSLTSSFLGGYLGRKRRRRCMKYGRSHGRRVCRKWATLKRPRRR